MPKSRWIPVSIAAARLRLSREATIRRVQRGLLRGRVTDDGHWEVDPRDLDRFLAEAPEAKPA